MIKLFRDAAVLRSLTWRVGRKMYKYARGDGRNDPHTNGEYWLLEQHLTGTQGPKVLLDIGANKGDWTAQAVRLGKGSSAIRVHAFEPSHATRSLLSARFLDHASVTVQPYALSDSVGQATFYGDDESGGTRSLSPSSGPKEATVDVITVDAFIKQSGLQAVSMVKIDTEGYDLLVLRGSERALANGLIEVLQFEYNWRWLVNHGSLRDVFDLISDKPYRLGKLIGASMEFYDRWHFELDRYFENNYVLLRKGSALRSLGVDVYFDRTDTIALRGARHSAE